jgi:hypothetical protein
MTACSRGAPGVRAVDQLPPSETKGAGKAGRRLAPMVRVQQKARGRTTGAAEIARPSLRDGVTAYTWSPRGPALLPPSPAQRPRRLDLSTGRSERHDFTVRSGAFVRMIRSCCALPHPPHPPSRVVTIAIRPSCRERTAQHKHTFWKNEIENFAQSGGILNTYLKYRRNLVFARRLRWRAAATGRPPEGASQTRRTSQATSFSTRSITPLPVTDFRDSRGSLLTPC